MKVETLRGKWMYVKDHNTGKEYARFVVLYLAENGEVKKAYSRSMFSHDIQEATRYTTIF
jgi:hypothetical protein